MIVLTCPLHAHPGSFLMSKGFNRLVSQIGQHPAGLLATHREKCACLAEDGVPTNPTTYIGVVSRISTGVILLGHQA